MNKEKIIESLFGEFSEIRYVAIYIKDKLVYKQKEETSDSSSGETDKYEELLVNPTLLKLASQRGNIDCGGLNYLIIGYGNFYQVVKSVPEGHISICIEQKSDLNELPNSIFDYLNEKFENLMTNK
ncbi:MAG: hypothetical protein MI810_02475 [Flavobacteriales bacterium]|nr:hypothetical protein [Flavobacteriales bacterium]